MKNKILFNMFLFILFIFATSIMVFANADCVDGHCGSEVEQIKEKFNNDASVVTSVKNIQWTETNYGLSLDEAIEIQATANAPPITSLYSDAPAYVERSAVRFIQPTKLYGTMINIKAEPSAASETALIFFGMSKVFIKNIVVGKEYKDSQLWYEIGHLGKSYYVHANDVLFPRFQMIDDTDVYEDSDRQSHVFGSVDAGKTLNVLSVENDMLEINYQYWRIPKREDMKRYLQPINNNVFQFVRLDQPTGVSAEQVNKIIAGKGILDSFGHAFVEAAEKYVVNDAYLVAHSLLETGGGTSPLATGVEVGRNDADELVIVTEGNRHELTEIKTTYNMYGIGAVDSCPKECGAIRAYEAGWFQPETAIIEGAKFVSEQYVYNDFSQNTLFKMKWNPFMKDGSEWKQYATDIGWAEKQTETIETIYRQLDDPKLTIDLPIFE